ncbi:hypothetical protein WR25_12537 isoform A [Diploscapter pachys]|uniref:Uncharacterized protein n=1 Tax=Diploscapter pachys TaxID=2018661 RepID=A0A2A2JUU0_9BILA|nr:hypothetical protein WR25_12537 isoform A [Diploscapter pachys]
MGGSSSSHHPSPDMMDHHHQFPDMNVLFKDIHKMIQVADDMHRMTDYIMDLRNLTILMFLMSALGILCFLCLRAYTRSKSRKRKRSFVRNASPSILYSIPKTEITANGNGTMSV